MFSRICNQRFPLVRRNLAIVPLFPSNVQLADTSVLQPIPEKIIKPLEFLFPLKNIPPNVPIVKFNDPGHHTDEMAPLDPRIFTVAIRKDIVLEVVRFQRNRIRQPKKTKRIGEIAGSTRKQRPQKGGGTSRAGNRRSSIWRGGQKAHGPVLRDYSIGLNRKYRALGMMVVLSAKFREGNLIIFDDLVTQTHKSKDLTNILKAHNLHTNKLLLVDVDKKSIFDLASRNLPLVEYMGQMSANVYSIMKCEKLAMSAAAFRLVQDRVMQQYLHEGKRKAIRREHLLRTEMIEKYQQQIKLKKSNESS